MSRFKVALGLIVMASAATVMAIAMRPSNSQRHVIDHREAAGAVGDREQRSSPGKSRNDAILKNFGTSTEESNRETSAPRMQTRQIKMH